MLAHDGGNPTDRHGLLARGNVTDDPIDAYTSNNDGAPSGQSRIFGYVAGKVEQIAGTWVATDSRTCRLNGIAATADLSSIAINNTRYLVLGTGFSGGAVTTAYLDGLLADAATLAAQTALASGAEAIAAFEAALGDGWRSTDGVARITTAAGIVALHASFVAHGAACDRRSQALKSLIDAAETLSDLAAVEAELTTSWPEVVPS